MLLKKNIKQHMVSRLKVSVLSIKKNCECQEVFGQHFINNRAIYHAQQGYSRKQKQQRKLLEQKSDSVGEVASTAVRYVIVFARQKKNYIVLNIDNIFCISVFLLTNAFYFTSLYESLSLAEDKHFYYFVNSTKNLLLN
jgi:hypothetical protein